MRCLNKNKKTIYYATYTGKTEIKDSNEFATGEYTNSYGNPVMLKANVSESTGIAYTEEFGIMKNYSKTMVIDDLDCPISETSILWIDTMPTLVEGATTTPHDHIVARVSKSLNNITYGIKRIDVR